MPEATIKYKKPETLKILKGLAKYFDFTISADKKPKNDRLKDILIPGDESVNISGLEKVITDSGMDAKKLRDSWKR
jgi:hypothetical protein